MNVWDTSCIDWAGRLKRGESIIPKPIFPAEAEAGLAVMRELRIVDAPGSPTFGEACAPWVFDLAASIFGAYEVESGRRLITEWFVCLPKKNSKSTIAAAIMLTTLIRNWRQSAEFIILAPTVEIANNSYAPARDMCSEKADEELNELMLVQTHIKTITHRNSAATLKVVAADSNTVGGKKAVGVLIDEAWLFGKVPNAENMLREATGGLASRPEGFVIWLTTQSDDPPAGVFKQKLRYARDVRDGKIVDPRFVPVIYEFPEEMIKAGEDREPRNFGMVNPNLDYSVDREFLEREFGKAQNDGEESMRGFLAKHLNVEIGLALRSDRWAGADVWAQAAHGPDTLDELISLSEVLTIGIDGGGLDDLLGLAVIGRHATTRQWMHWGRAWACPTVLERRKAEAPRFRDFERDGDLVIVETIGPDVQQVAEIVKRAEDSGKLNMVGLDPAGVGDIKEAIEQASKRAGDKCVGISQGWKLTSAIKTAERALAEGRLLHADQPMLAWSVSNAKIVPAGNAILVTKQASGSAKIDPLMALFNAVDLMARNPASPVKEYRMIFA